MTATKFGSQYLELPVVLYFEEKLSVDPGDGLRVIGMKFTDSNVLLCKTHARQGYVDKPGWILESNGMFREFTPRKRRREWAKPLSFLVQFVQSEYVVSDARSISVGELSVLLRDIKDDFKEAPQAADLRRHLRKYPENEAVTERLLRDWPI